MSRFFVFILFGMLNAGQQEFVEGKLTGQIGNQMFVIAATVGLALDHGATAIFPGLLTDKTNNIPLNYQKVFYHLDTRKMPRRGIKEYHEPDANYRQIPYRPNMKLYGYFQSEKYFQRHKEEICALFAPHPEILNYLQENYSEILKEPITVSIHLRSYHDHDPDQKIYIQYGLDYFERAMQLFPEETLFVVFSNRMNWCKELFANVKRRLIFVENEPHYHDLYLMSLCKHNIICNSSFSWWAAYLNKNPDKVIIAPTRWYTPGCGIGEKDLVPEGWVRL